VSQWRLGRFLGRAKNVGDPFTFYIKPVRQDNDVREPRVLPRSVVRECVDENAAPPDSNDCADMPVADILFPSIPSPVEPLETIFEEPVDDDESNLDAEDTEPIIDASDKRVVADMVIPETVELEDCIDGNADVPLPMDSTFKDSEELFPNAGGIEDDMPPTVTQDDTDDDGLQYNDPGDASVAANIVNDAYSYLREWMVPRAILSRSLVTVAIRFLHWNWKCVGPMAIILGRPSHLCSKTTLRW
jgi:hypothetical protein